MAEPLNKSTLCTVAGIGASAGGLEAATDLLSNLAPGHGMAFVLIQHLDAAHDSGLADLLSRRTQLHVAEATEGVRVEPDHVYVIPPNTRMTIRDCHLYLTARAAAGPAHLPIDHFLCSLAQDLKHRSIGIVLSGTGHDGSIGLEAIKSEGGLTFAQDKSARFDEMPRQAVAAGVVDFVLSADKIAAEITALSGHIDSGETRTEVVFADRPSLESILALLRDSCGVDFTHYKANTIQRRLFRRLALNRVHTLADYLAIARDSKEEMARLFDDLLITVTDFFRDPETFESLANNALPRLFDQRAPSDPLRVWVVGCSAGKEAYSIAIAIVEEMKKRKVSIPVQIFGTDISDKSIEIARSGRFPESISSTISPERLSACFVRIEGGYRIAGFIRDMCIFSRHDVTRDTPLAKMDLISCRNLLIYLGPVLQRRVLQMFAYSLKPGGVLLLGQSEAVGSHSALFNPLDLRYKIYTRAAGAATSSLFESSPGSLRFTTPAPVALQEEGDAALRLAGRMLMDEYAPAALLINSRHEVVRLFGNIGTFLTAGEHTGRDVFSVLAPPLAGPLRKSLQAARAGTAIARESFAGADNENMEIVVRPLVDGAQVHYLVALEKPLHRLRRLAVHKPGDTGRPAEDLALDLAATRTYMQRLVEELRAANEEAQSSNEELQSTNEELQTAKEELQSSNEELVTTNEEMQGRNAELHQVNSDLINLLRSLQIPILMLDRALRICRYTPRAERLFNIIPSDIGRPISDLNSSIDVPGIIARLHEVVAIGEPRDYEVRDVEGRWYSMRLQPFRTNENRIDGVVLQLLDIHDLKQNIASLARAREYADAIVAAVSESLVVLNADLRVESVNQSFRATFRCDAHEPIGQPVFELNQRRWDTPAVRDILAAALRGESPSDIEIEECEGHQWRTFAVGARRLGPSPGDTGGHSVLFAIQDISDRKRAAEAKYRRLFESAKDGILILDAASGAVSDANPFALELLSRSREEIVEKPFWESLPLPEGSDQGGKLLEQLRVNGTVRMPDLEIGSLHGPRTVEVIGSLYEEMRRKVVQFNMRDITDRRQFERQLQQTAKLESLGVLAGGIAHDFNNLLTGIMGNASLALLDSNVSSRYRSALSDVVKASQRAAELTSQMLAYAGKGRYIVRPVNLSELVRDIAALIRTSLPRHVDVAMRLEERLPLVEADAGQLQQVVMNLVINAAESMEDRGGGAVRVRTALEHFDPAVIPPRVAADDLRAGLFVLFEVGDTGGGMDEATLDRIFDPFFTTKFTGRGLGLAAVQGIVRGHRGALSVQSTPGRGSTFRLYLPPSAQHNEPAVRPPAAEELRGTGTVLVVDDESDLVTLATSVLNFHGYESVSAANGEEALRIVRERGDSLSIVLLDINMPVMDGEEALKQLAVLRPGLPVIVCTGYDSREVGSRLAMPNLAGVLQKPYTVQQMLTVLKEKLQAWNPATA